MAALFKDFQKMIDISEEAEQAEAEQEAGAGGAGAAAQAPLRLEAHEFDVIAKRADAVLQRRGEEYTALLTETQRLRAEYDVFKGKADGEAKALRRTVAELQHAATDLKNAAAAGGGADAAYTSGLERQAESLKEQLRKTDAEVQRLEKKCKAAELGKELAQAQRSQDLTALALRLDCWRGVAEAKLAKAAREVEAARHGAPSAAAAAGDEREAAASSSLDEIARLQTEVEATVADNLDLRRAADELRTEAGQLASQLGTLHDALERARSDAAADAEQYKLTIAALEGTIASMATQAKELNAQTEAAGMASPGTPGGQASPAVADRQYQVKAKEALDLRQRVEELQGKAALLGTQLETEKECVRNVMQLLDDTREENRRKEEQLSDLFSETEGSRARLQSLETMAAAHARAQEAKDEALAQGLQEKAALDARVAALGQDVEAARAGQREAEGKVVQLERSERRLQEVVTEREAELEKVQAALQGREGETQRELSGKDEETGILRKRLDDSEKRLHDALRARDDLAAQVRTLERSARRSVSTAPARRSTSPVIDIVDAPLAAARAAVGKVRIGSLAFTRNTLVCLVGATLLMGMFVAYSSLGMLSPEWDAMEKELAICKDRLLQCSVKEA
eukprot:TRINITY_DN19669_c0_g1_i2.p1 TRINITY_DN19669_c0_g1~~TRINITY_DN19669_c0_g1_i2.p1  ORF type:complete len:629 (+),score=285.84 TRINITY_DN19669_c0_g1_i2:79-1965(+)